jgi:hypothetical protein
MTLRDRVRERAASLAAEAGVIIEHVGKAHMSKEDVVARVPSVSPTSSSILFPVLLAAAGAASSGRA